MRAPGSRGKTVFGGLALVAAFALVQVASASAATFPNACKNSVTANNSQIGVTMTANTSPNPVAPGGSVSLTNIDQTANVPGTIFVAGYNLGLLTTGSNTIPAIVQTTIEGTNTVEGTQVTNIPATSVTTTISDPDGSPGTGDETGTDGVINVSYADQTWTAGASGTINFREDTLPISAGGGALHTGGIKITATIAGFLSVRFGCSPGTVAGPDPGVVTLDDPAATFASTEIQAANQPPVANAGADQTVDSEQAGVSLDGSGSSDPDGDPITYSWTQTSGPAVSLSGANTATPSFTAPVGPATLEFELTVDDGEASDTDTVAVNVNAAPNIPPIADAGDDQTVDSEQAGVSLDGSGSTDPDGDPITYSWTQTSGPAVSLSGANTATPSFDAPLGPATLEFELTVDDGEASDTDTVAVNVNEPVVEHQPPVADAGADQTVDSEQAGVSLDGSGSTDPDGDPITYSWTQTSGPAVSLSGANTATPSFDAPVGPATLEFELTVDDGEASDTDTVAVNVNAAPNIPPIADAGDDQTVDSEQAGVSLDGSGSTDPDGDPITYSWTQTSGPAVSLSGANTATPSFDAPLGPATLEFELTVDDGEASDTDTVVVNVNEPVVENQPPVADAGADQTVDSEQAGVSLDGSGSTDPDGDPITYSWTQTSGPAVSLSGANTATPSFDAPLGPATLEFELTVDDGEASDTDTVAVNVNAAPNIPPIADAGDDQTVDSEQAGVSLDGSGSTDPDGDPITYSWTQTSGPAVSLSGANTATPSFDAPLGPATLEFELTVDDGEASDTDTVVVNVNEPVVENQPPVADAGPTRRSTPSRRA